MSTDIIPYDVYHPHLGYTLAITCLAWVCVALYSRFRLQQRPKQRIRLYALAIGLPIYAEVGSYLIYLFRPAPHTPIGYYLSHFHAFVLQRLPLDTFLEPLVEEVALGLLVLITLMSLARFGYGTWQLMSLLQDAKPLRSTSHAHLGAQFAQATVHFGHTMPTIMILHHETPLACTIGLLAPAIYLSSGLLELLTPDEIVAVLCHEWAHILRRDNLWNWVVRLLRDLLFFLPANHLLWRSMVASQDEACDALAAEMTHEPLVLARALVKVAAAWKQYEEPISLPVASPFALATASPRSRIEQMMRISDAEVVPAGRAVGAYVLAGALLVLAVLPALLGS
jgi:Zn-dependent protease with chaperone function